MRRALPKRCRALPGVVSGESETSTPDHFSINPQQITRDNSNSFPNQLNANSQFDASVEESRPKTAKKDIVLLLVVNIQCLKARLTEFCFHLESLRPHIVLLQETWLDESVEDISIPGYKTISRRDRAKTENRGGVLTLARVDFFSAHIAK